MDDDDEEEEEEEDDDDDDGFGLLSILGDDGMGEGRRPEDDDKAVEVVAGVVAVGRKAVGVETVGRMAIGVMVVDGAAAKKGTGDNEDSLLEGPPPIGRNCTGLGIRSPLEG